MPLLDRFLGVMLKKRRFGWRSAIGVAAAIPLYFIVAFGVLFWHVRANESACQQVVESLRDRYPKLEIRSSSGAEHLQIRVIGASDDKVEREIMDWLRAESEKRRLPPVNLELD